MSSHLFKIFSAFLILILLSACATAPSSGPQAMQGAMAAEPLADYKLRTGDDIQIKFFYHSGLNVQLMIGPDGKISLELVGQVLAAGLTSSQLEEVLTREYAKYLENYSVIVVVRAYSGLRVYVGGEVERPGFFPLRGNMSILQGILTRGGFTNYAKPENVILVRKGPENKPVAMVIDLGHVMYGEQLENDIYLMPSDIVYVPMTFIGKAGIFVDQYLRRMFFVDTLLSGVGYALGYKWIWGD